MMQALCDTIELKTEQSRLLDELDSAAVMTERIVAENKTAVMDQGEYQKLYNDLLIRYESAKNRYEMVSGMIADRQGKWKVYMQFIGGLKRMDGFCKDFDEELWTALLDTPLFSPRMTSASSSKPGTK